jgi:hypothetical protein
MGRFRGAASLRCAGKQGSPAPPFKFSLTECELSVITNTQLVFPITDLQRGAGAGYSVQVAQ